MPTVLPSTETSRDVEPEGGWKLNGFHVLVILVLFFGSVAAVNGVMIYDALSTFRGEVVAHPYEKGIAYNSDIKEAREQEARGWKVDGVVNREADGMAHIAVTARDATGAALAGLQMHATLEAPADVKRDKPIELSDAGGGAYQGATQAQPGVWDLELTASRDGKVLFQSRNRIKLR